MLCSARNSGFKTSDPFLDIKNFIIKIQEINKDLEQYKKKQLDYFNKIKNNYTLNDIPIDLEDKDILKQNYLNNPGVIFL